jgi:excisionase family DNA binding protein
MTSGQPPIRAAGGRLISVAEAARILHVAESDVSRWIAAGKIQSVTVPGGERRLQLLGETHERSGPNRGGFISLQLHHADIDELAAREFQRELAGARRAAQLARLPETQIDADALATALARSLAGVAPAQLSILAEGGIVWIKDVEGHGAGSDIALLVSDDGVAPREQARRAAERTLEVAQEMIAEETADPWPARAGQLPGGFPCPHAEIVDGSIRLYYGDPRTPILALPAISLDAMRRS